MNRPERRNRLQIGRREMKGLCVAQNLEKEVHICLVPRADVRIWLLLLGCGSCASEREITYRCTYLTSRVLAISQISQQLSSSGHFDWTHFLRQSYRLKRAGLLLSRVLRVGQVRLPQQHRALTRHHDIKACKTCAIALFVQVKICSHSNHASALPKARPASIKRSTRCHKDSVWRMIYKASHK